MYAHERTMLARLGFADPDRADPQHDLACQYLSTADAVRRLVPRLGIEHGCRPECHSWGNTEQESQVSRTVDSHQATLEYEIAKGSGPYRTTVGFADVVLNLTVRERHSHVRQRIRKWRDADGNQQWSEWQSVNDCVYRLREVCGLEIKIKRTSIGALLRQVKLYRSYSGIKCWVVATAYNIAPSDVECLGSENIVHVRLGANFEAYVASQNDHAATPNAEV